MIQRASTPPADDVSNWDCSKINYIKHIGSHKCEVCGWLPPQINKKSNNIMELHHIVPLRCGGKHKFSNLILLCPNHHRICHNRFSISNKTGQIKGSVVWPAKWDGATTKEELIAALLGLS